MTGHLRLLNGMLLDDIVGILHFPDGVCVGLCLRNSNPSLSLVPFSIFSSFPVEWDHYGNCCLSSFLLNKTIDVLLYVDRLDAYRVDNLDRQVVKAITDSFGKGIWNRALVVLTHAQLSPPDGLPYEDFCSKRSGALLKVVRLGAGLKKLDKQVQFFKIFSPDYNLEIHVDD